MDKRHSDKDVSERVDTLQCYISTPAASLVQHYLQADQTPSIYLSIKPL